MIPEKYLKKIRSEIREFNKEKDLKFFIFGSSLRKEHFGDIDIGFIGQARPEAISKLKEKFINSTLPYNIDIIGIDKTSEEFKKNIFKNKILWLTPSD